MSQQLQEFPTPPVAPRMKRAKQAVPLPALEINVTLETQLQKTSSGLPSAIKRMEKNTGWRTRRRKP